MGERSVGWLTQKFQKEYELRTTIWLEVGDHSHSNSQKLIYPKKEKLSYAQPCTHSHNKAQFSILTVESF